MGNSPPDVRGINHKIYRSGKKCIAAARKRKTRKRKEIKNEKEPENA